MRARSTTGGIALLLIAAVLASCGGDSPSDPKAPRIPAAVAERLAGLSDDTAEALEVGDDCAAQEVADQLERETLKAESQIPAELRSEVTRGVRQLTAAIECVPEPVIKTVPEETTTEELPPCPPGQEKKEDDHGDHGDEGGHGKDEQTEEEKKKEEEQKKKEEEQRKICEEARHEAERGSGEEGEG
jgi:hypothetical protein